MSYIPPITYSHNNTKANDYYNALSKFYHSRDELRAYELKTDDRESNKYQQLVKEFEFWDSEAPKLSDIAGQEEEKLVTKKEEKKQNNNYTSSPFYKDGHMDFMA